MDKSEFEVFYDAFSGTVYRTAFLLLKNRADAEDLTQDVFIALYKRNGGFSDGEHTKAWLLRVCANKAKNLLKRRAVERKYLKAPEPCPDGGSEVLKAVLSLETGMSTVIYLFYYEGYSTEEIAAIIGKSGGAVRVMLTRARGALKSVIELDGD